jgi:hypothetical protein
LTGEEKAKAGLGIGIIVFAAILMLIIRSQPNNEMPNEPMPIIQAEKALESAEETEEAETPSSSFDDIKVTADFQDFYYDRGKQKVVIWIKNESSQTFSGKVYVRIVDNADISYGRDVIYPENLMPRKSIWAIVWTKPEGQILSYKIDGKFEGEPKAETTALEVAKEYYKSQHDDEITSCESLGEVKKGEKIIDGNSIYLLSGEKIKINTNSCIYVKDRKVTLETLLYNGKEHPLRENPRW